MSVITRAVPSILSQSAASGIVFEDSATTTNTTNVTSQAFTLPTVATDELLLAFMVSNQDIPYANVTDPTGWTNLYWAISTNGNDRSLAAYWRLADGTEGSTATISWTTPATRFHTYCVSLSGVDTVTPVSASDTVTPTTTTTPDSQDASLTASSGDWAFTHITVQSNSTSISANPTGYTQRDNRSFSSEICRVCSDELTGNPDNGTWTLSASTNRWLTGMVIAQAA